MRSPRFCKALAFGIAPLLLLPPGHAAGVEGTSWSLAPALLTSHWAREVAPDHVRPEHLRPQMVRPAWQSLNGLWQFAFDDPDQGRAAGWTQRALTDVIDAHDYGNNLLRQGVGGWGTAARFLRKDGTPLRDLRPSR
jgi:hypothetical protein